METQTWVRDGIFNSGNDSPRLSEIFRLFVQQIPHFFDNRKTSGGGVPTTFLSKYHNTPHRQRHNTDAAIQKPTPPPLSQGVTLREAEAGRKLKFFRLPTTTTKDRRAIDLPPSFSHAQPFSPGPKTHSSSPPPLAQKERRYGRKSVYRIASYVASARGPLFRKSPTL